MRHPHRHHQLGAAMRGQRPALASLLAWVALLGLLLGSLALLAPSADPLAPSALLQAPLPVEERGGGEVPLHEQAPAKLRRASLADEAPAAQTAPDPGAAIAVFGWTLLAHTPTDTADPSRDWRHASAQPPRADAPGRRQQRGQAPPLA
ncbi:hypothetical protein [Stenotrophomonas chelatiphaga]|uniref:hypothetical protein n=1 Tax=Stenotrophomonas chelatiphaga TaxID=517011 RepID=UPI002896401E|nr:hypothetical protein [Stenotrophomonas chelatiphaga]